MFGDGPTTVLFLPTWQLVYSRTWKMQVPYLARHYRVVAFDPRGNGRSSRPADAAAYTIRAMADDALDVLDATETRSAIVVGYSRGGVVLATLAVHHPERVDGAVFIAPVSALGAPAPRSQHPWSEQLATSDGWAKHNKHYWRRDYDDWLEFFAGKLFTEPHSTKGIEDVMAWGHETDAQVLTATYEAPRTPDDPPSNSAEAGRYYARISCPVLVIHGRDDAVIDHSSGAGVAQATGGMLATIDGAGHAPHARHPVRVNLMIRRFVDRIASF